MKCQMHSKLVKVYCYLMTVFLREVKSTTGKVISDEDLEFLLDRSDLLGEFDLKTPVMEWDVVVLSRILRSFVGMLYLCRAPVPSPVEWPPDEPSTSVVIINLAFVWAQLYEM